MTSLKEVTNSWQPKSFSALRTRKGLTPNGAETDQDAMRCDGRSVLALPFSRWDNQALFSTYYLRLATSVGWTTEIEFSLFCR